MKGKKNLIVCIIEIILGILISAFSIFDSGDSYWTGMGFALIAVGVLRLLRQLRYRADAAYREKAEVEAKDERNKFISSRAWALAGTSFIMLAAVASVVFKIAGQEQLMMMASGSVCLILVVYWLSYMVLRKKY